MARLCADRPGMRIKISGPPIEFLCRKRTIDWNGCLPIGTSAKCESCLGCDRRQSAAAADFGSSGVRKCLAIAHGYDEAICGFLEFWIPGAGFRWFS